MWIWDNVVAPVLEFQVDLHLLRSRARVEIFFLVTKFPFGNAPLKSSALSFISHRQRIDRHHQMVVQVVIPRGRMPPTFRRVYIAVAQWVVVDLFDLWIRYFIVANNLRVRSLLW